MVDAKAVDVRVKSHKQAFSMIASDAGVPVLANLETQYGKVTSAKKELETTDANLRTARNDRALLKKRLVGVVVGGIAIIREMNCGRIVKLGPEVDLHDYDVVDMAGRIATEFKEDPDLKAVASVVSKRCEAYVASDSNVEKLEKRLSELSASIIPLEAALEHAFTDTTMFVKMNSAKGSPAWNLVKKTYRAGKKKASKKQQVAQPEVKAETVSTAKAA